MKNQQSFFILIFLISGAVFAQKKDLVKKKLPVSIYTFSSIKTGPNSFSPLNKRLALDSYKFMIVDANEIESNVASFNFKNIGKTPSTYIYDDYQRYQDTNLLKGFLLKNDPTRWNLACIENRIQPYFLN